MKWNSTLVAPSPLLVAGSLLFNGTSLWLTSEATSDATSYNITFDSSPSVLSPTKPSDRVLFHAQDLSNSSIHSFSVDPPSILQSVIIEMDLPADQSVVIDDSQVWSSHSTANPADIGGSWTKDQCMGPGRSGMTCHTTQTPGSYVIYYFTGYGITVYGSVESAKSGYAVSLDGSPLVTYSGFTPTDGIPSVPLAHFGSLPQGEHRLAVINTPADNQSRLEIDAFELWVDKKEFKDFLYPSTNSLPMSTKVGLSVGTIGGIVVLVIMYYGFMHFRSKALVKNSATRSTDRLENGADVAVSRKTRIDTDEGNVRDHRHCDSVSSILKSPIPLSPMSMDTLSVVRTLPVEEAPVPSLHYSQSRAYPRSEARPKESIDIEEGAKIRPPGL